MAIDLNLEIEIAKARRAQAQAQAASPAPAAAAAPTPAAAAPTPPPTIFDPTVLGRNIDANDARLNPSAPAAPAPAPASVYEGPGTTSYGDGGATKLSDFRNIGPSNPTGKADLYPWGNGPLDVLWHAAVANSQAGLRGAADLAGAPVDVPLAAARGTGWLYNQGAGPLGLPQVPNINFSMADTIANAVSALAAKAGIPPLQMTPPEQTMQTPIEWGTAGLIGGMPGAARAGTVAAKIATGVDKPSFIDKLSLPYIERPAAAAGRDFSSGAVASLAADRAGDTADYLAPGNVPAKTVAELFAGLAGGVGGAAGAQAITGAAHAPAGMWRRMKNDTNIAGSQTGAPFTQAQTDLAARVFQGDASNPATAKTNIEQNSADLTAMGVPAGTLTPTGPTGAQPTSGLLSGDPGLVNLETSFRARDPAPFIQRDQAVKGVAADRVASLTNPAADQTAVGPGIKGAVQDIKTERDMEAFPLLMKAENAGAVVDAQPVADLIDQKLALTKRPSVRAALTEARTRLNTIQADPKAPAVLDTSVSGLYETRKALNDIIEGRGENATGRFASKELIQVRDALDAAITKVAPEFGDYLTKYTAGSAPLDAVRENTSAQSLINGEDPRNVAQGLFRGYGGETRAKEVSGLVANDPQAAAGWKAAVAEVLVDKVTGTKVAGDNYEASFASLSREFKKNEDVLVNVFTPEEMSTLRQAQTLLGYFKAGENRATTGSQTAERLLRTSEADRLIGGPIGRTFELAMKHIYGNLEGGGIVRRARLMASLLPTDRSASTEIAKMAFFNPDVAAYLLGKPVRNLASIPANNGLRAAIATDLAEQDQVSNGR